MGPKINNMCIMQNKELLIKVLKSSLQHEIVIPWWLCFIIHSQYHQSDIVTRLQMYHTNAIHWPSHIWHDYICSRCSYLYTYHIISLANVFENKWPKYGTILTLAMGVIPCFRDSHGHLGHQHAKLVPNSRPTCITSLAVKIGVFSQFLIELDMWSLAACGLGLTG